MAKNYINFHWTPGQPAQTGTERLDGAAVSFAAIVVPGILSPARKKILTHRLMRQKERIAAKCKCDRYIAYFQSFTNTYGDLESLKACFLKAAARKDIAVLSIATRPDCVDDAVIEMLREIRKQKPVWVELGLQTIREDTAERINRCYPLSAYDEAVKKLQKAGCSHHCSYDSWTSGESKKI